MKPPVVCSGAKCRKLHAIVCKWFVFIQLYQYTLAVLYDITSDLIVQPLVLDGMEMGSKGAVTFPRSIHHETICMVL